MLLLDGGISTNVIVSKPNKTNIHNVRKISASTTYNVTITHDLINNLSKDVIINDYQVLDFEVSLVDGVTIFDSIFFVSILGGTFEMGSNDGFDINKPVHDVTLSSFEIGAYEVTYAQYCDFLNKTLDSGEILVKNTSVICAKGEFKNQEYFHLEGVTSHGDVPHPLNECWIKYRNDRFEVEPGYENWPVVYVTWYGAKAFANYFNFDLPTEAEWEYAARGNRQYDYATYDGNISLDRAHYGGGTAIHHPVDVGSYPPNPFKLFDMTGNVLELCQDWYGNYNNESTTNPKGPQSGISKIARGGSWMLGGNSSCTYSRGGVRQYIQVNTLGFRVVRRNQLHPLSRHSIKGEILYNDVALEGASLRLTGNDENKNIYIDDDSFYTFKGIYNGTYILTPSMPGYTFIPSSIEISVEGEDIIVENIYGLPFEDFPSGLVFSSIPGGRFKMGDEIGDLGVFPGYLHTVELSGFQMSSFEITNLQYSCFLNIALSSGDISVTSEDVVGAEGLYNGKKYLSIHGERYEIETFVEYTNKIIYLSNQFEVEPGYENWPVVYVTWYGAKAFANYFNFDLPTEAEWEYAARGGNKYLYGTNDGLIDSTKANYANNIGQPIDVGSYQPNLFGLYDMSGNVYEMCLDGFAYYPKEDWYMNPLHCYGELEGIFPGYRITRGGSWKAKELDCRTAFRYMTDFERPNDDLGFRVVCRPGGLIY